MATSTARPQASKPENRGSNYEKPRLMRVGSLRDLREETGRVSWFSRNGRVSAPR